MTLDDAKLIDQLCHDCTDWARRKGWNDQEVPFAEFIALCHTELSEAFEHYRDGHSLHHIFYHDDGKPDGIPVELADVLLRIFHFCGRNKLSLGQALFEKFEFNNDRPYRHGGKKC